MRVSCNYKSLRSAIILPHLPAIAWQDSETHLEVLLSYRDFPPFPGKIMPQGNRHVCNGMLMPWQILDIPIQNRFCLGLGRKQDLQLVLKSHLKISVPFKT